MIPPAPGSTTATTTAGDEVLEHTYGARSVDPFNVQAKLVGVRLADDQRYLAWRNTRELDPEFHVTCYYMANVQVDESFVGQPGDVSEIASPFAAAARKLLSVFVARRRNELSADK